MSHTEMRMSLQRERGECAAKLAAVLLSGNDDEAARLKARLETINAAIVALPSSRRADVLRVVTVGLVTAVVVTILLIKEAHFVPVMVDIRSRSLAADFDSAGS